MVLKSSAKKIWVILGSKGQKKLVLFSLLLFLSAMADVVGLASLIPLFSSLLQPEFLFAHPFFGRLLEMLHIENEKELVWLFLGITPAIFILKNLVTFVINRLALKWVFGISQQLSAHIVKHFYNLGYEYLLYQNTFKANFQIIMLPVQFTTITLRAVMGIISETSVLVVVLVLTATFNLKLLLILLAFSLPVALIFSRWGSKKLELIGQTRNEYAPKNAEWLHKILDSYAEFKLYGAEQAFINEYLHIQQKLNAMRFKKFGTQLYPKRIFETIAVMAFCSIGVYFFLTDKTVESFLITAAWFGVIAYRLNPALIQLVQSNLDIADSANTIHLLHEHITNSKKEILPPKMIKMAQQLELQNLSFEFDEKPIFSGVSLLLKKGDRVAISGESGVGKSTLGKTLIGLLKAKSGRILVDDVELEFGQKQLASVGYLPAQISLLNTGIYENVALTLNLNNEQKERVEYCLQLSALREFIGNNKQIGLNGKFVSSGQQQRIGLARALYFNPEILVLDEFTANLDTETEAEILENLKSAANSLSLSIIVFTHRKAVLELATKHYELTQTGLVQR
ncbi:MAG: ABC transporter ATP-binding protein/permease [Bacteroidetes bacterium]|nr:ABC transporter ATP-binding protein/permease [Bacteroidota bacterium]